MTLADDAEDSPQNCEGVQDLQLRGQQFLNSVGRFAEETKCMLFDVHVLNKWNSADVSAV